MTDRTWSPGSNGPGLLRVRLPVPYSGRMTMTPKSQNMTIERAIGSRGRHVRGIGESFAVAYQRAARDLRSRGINPENGQPLTEEAPMPETTVDAFALPEEPARTERPATDGMVRFCWSLATYRDMPEEIRDAMLLVLEGHRNPESETVLPFNTARAFIDRYKDAGKRQSRPTTPAAGPAEVTEDGMYRNPETGEIYKVQYNRGSGDGRRLYAKILVVETEPVRDEDGKIVAPAVVRFDYAAGAIRRLRPEWRMSLEQAKEFGALYGTCVRCGRALTLEASIERAMGTTCAGKF